MLSSFSSEFCKKEYRPQVLANKFTLRSKESTLLLTQVYIWESWIYGSTWKHTVRIGKRRGGGGWGRTVTCLEQETLPSLLPFHVLLDNKLHIYLSCCVQNVQSYVFTIHVNMMSVCWFCGETHVVFQQRKVCLTLFNNYNILGEVSGRRGGPSASAIWQNLLLCGVLNTFNSGWNNYSNIVTLLIFKQELCSTCWHTFWMLNFCTF